MFDPGRFGGFDWKRMFGGESEPDSGDSTPETDADGEQPPNKPPDIAAAAAPDVSPEEE